VNVNKTYLTMAGIGLTCLVTGATGGFFFTKKKFYSELDEIIANELAATKKHYELRLKQAREKPATPAEAVQQIAETNKVEEAVKAKKAEKIAAEMGYKRPETPAVAYNRIVQEKEVGAHQINENNIWRDQDPDDREAPNSLRAPNGRFQAKNKALAETSIEDTPPVELISAEEFLGDTMGYQQVNLVWYLDGDNGTLQNEVSEDTLDIEDVGGVDMLKLLSDVEPDKHGERIICVRNHGDGVDYEIKLSEANLVDIQDAKQS
jgi:hypothetical protein